jgi:hypothetical protein
LVADETHEAFPRLGLHDQSVHRAKKMFRRAIAPGARENSE